MNPQLHIPKGPPHCSEDLTRAGAVHTQAGHGSQQQQKKQQRSPGAQQLGCHVHVHARPGLQDWEGTHEPLSFHLPASAPTEETEAGDPRQLLGETGPGSVLISQLCLLHAPNSETQRAPIVCWGSPVPHPAWAEVGFPGPEPTCVLRFLWTMCQRRSGRSGKASWRCSSARGNGVSHTGEGRWCSEKVLGVPPGTMSPRGIRNCSEIPSSTPKFSAAL